MKDKIISVAVNGNSQRSISMMPYQLSFGKFAESCSVAKKGGKYESYFIRGGDMSITVGEEDHKNAECRVDHYHRNDTSLLSADLLILDADGSVEDDSSAPDGELIHKTLIDMGIAHFIYSTHSHQTNGKGNRYRAIIPCKMTHKAQLRATVNKIIADIRKHGCPIGDVKEAKAWSQAWFFPTRDDPHDGLFEYYEYFDGAEYIAMDVDTNLSDKCEARKGVRRISRPRKEELEDRRSHESLIETILNGSEGLHHAINDFLYGQIKDGVAKATAIATLKGLMMSNPNKDERWQSRFDEIERSADGAIEKINIESNDRYTNSREILENLGLSKVNNEKPEYPFDTMRKWPHPWPLIWKNWKRFPAVVSEPLLVPTIIAFHGFMLNSKYLNARDRRPNLYQLSLAESTAYKDTNSTDVLRAMPTAMARHGIFNSIFDNLADGDSNISSDTALIKSLSENNGKKFWINTEATRVFQQLSTVSKGNMNPSVLALADKIIEVVDGKTITGKVKATEAMKSITDPNVQIVFYAQPETIERYITEEMVDSGFLGRALITLDVTETQEHSMFMQLPENHCQLDSDIAEFYGNCNLNEKAFFERYKCILKDENLNSAIKFEKDVLRPMMPVNDGPLRKMITRMGNSTEQLYSIVLGVCREWDAWQGNEIRESVSIDPLFDLLEFFAKCKHYVVNEYILESSDPVADSIVEGVTRFLDGTWTCERRYREFVKDGYVPRSILVNRVRSMKKVQDQASGYARMTGIISQTIDYMIFNQTLGQTEKSIGKSSKKTKFIYVAR